MVGFRGAWDREIVVTEREREEARLRAVMCMQATPARRRSRRLPRDLLETLQADLDAHFRSLGYVRVEWERGDRGDGV